METVQVPPKMTVFSTLRRTKDEYQAMERRKANLGFKPPIDFWKPPQKDEDAENDRINKEIYTTIKIPFQVDGFKQTQRPKYDRHVRVFKNGTAEQFCNHLYVCEELYTKLGYGTYWSFQKDDGSDTKHDCTGHDIADEDEEDHTYKQKMALFCSTLGSRALQHFETARRKYEAAKHAPDEDGDEAKFSVREVYESAVNELACLYFQHPGEAVKVQKRYLREGGLMFCGEYSSPREFYERLGHLNQLIEFFPFVTKANGTTVRPSPLDDDDLIEILDKARTTDMQKMMLALGDHARKYTDPEEYAKKLEEWHENVLLTKALEKAEKARNADNQNSKRKATPGDKSNNGGSSRKKRRTNEKNGGFKRTKPCVHCGNNHMVPDDKCWTLDENKDKRPTGWTKSKTKDKEKDKFDKAVSRQVAKATKVIKTHMLKKHARKRKVIEESEESEEEIPYSDSFMNRMKKLSTSDNESDSDTVSSYSTTDYSDNDSYDSHLCCEPLHLSFAFAPKNKKIKRNHYTAEVIIEIVDRHGNKVPARGLLDTGTSHSILLREFVKRGRAKGYSGKPTQWNTMGGQFITKRKALIDFKFPELDNNKKITWICHVDERTSPDDALYDIIIGMDLMTELGIYINTETKEIQWKGLSTPLVSRGTLQEPSVMNSIYHMAVNETVAEAEERQGRILDANYDKIDIEEHIHTLSHLNREEQDQLCELLEQYPVLFGGGLGKLDIKPIELELKPGSKPYHARAFPIPQSLERTTKKEIGRLKGIDVFELNSDSEWAAPTFVQPKKTGDVRILTDFRRLNECLVRKPFPLPKISDLLQKLRNFKYATAIDLSMGYYHIPLSKRAQQLCTTVLPWGKYRYKVLPMGIKNSPDIFQEIMSNMMGDLEFASTYLDDILIATDGTFEEHLAKVKVVLDRLEKANFRANIRKCFWGEQSIEYLGYQISRNGIQPQPKKVEAIQKLKAPTNVRQLRHFLGMVNYYRDMWKRRSHVLAPLTKLTGKGVPFDWGKDQDRAFAEIKRIMAQETILAYPNFSKPFHVYTDASNIALGAVIMQEDKPLAFYSRKMNSAQRNYTTGEQELLSIVETLKEFRSLLWGQELIVHTDHMNIVYGNLSNDRITRWRLLLEEYNPKFVHIKGTDNTVADALSRLDMSVEEAERTSDVSTLAPLLCKKKYKPGPVMASTMCMLRQDESAWIPDPNNPSHMAEAYASKKDTRMEQFPLDPALIAKYQATDKQCKKYSTDKKFKWRSMEGHKVLTTLENRLVVPRKLQERILAWYHLYLRHPGSTRMYETMKIGFWWNNMRQDVDYTVRTCTVCQKNKKTRKKYGKLPPKQAETESKPWERVNIDLIGPLTVKTPTKTHSLDALTMIDPATGWFEIKELHSRTAEATADAFDDAWLTRYPRPQYIGFDNGGENKGIFREMTDNYGLKRKPTTNYNPQGNGVCERVHAVLNDILRTFELEERELDEQNPWSEFLAAAAFAIRSTYHTTLQATPAQLVFGRDMILPISIKANWERIKERKQLEINRNNARENKDRIDHTYEVGDKVYLRKEGIQRKLSSPRDGPYKITAVYDNGTAMIQTSDAVSERVNIRRLTPHFG